MKKLIQQRKIGFRDPCFVLALLVFCFGVLPAPVFAYLDPGTGSFIFQILVGAVVGGVFFLKSYLASIKEKINSMFGRQSGSAVSKESISEHDSGKPATDEKAQSAPEKRE